VHGVPPTAVERRFFLFSEFYRWALRNRPALLDLLLVHAALLDPALAVRRVPFVDWLTDVGESTPSRKGCEIAYAYARLDPVNGTFSTLDLLLAYLPELYEEFQAQTAA
jgi:hypothetical protein